MQNNKSRNHKILILLTLFSILTKGYLYGQVSISNLSTPYNQNFNTLSNDTSFNVIHPITLNGWAIFERGTSASVDQQYKISDGTRNNGETYSYGLPLSTDRALGSVASGTCLSSYGIVFQNNTNVSITDFLISYKGEQWRSGDTSTTLMDSLVFEYSTTATEINDTNAYWIPVSALMLSSPNMITNVAGPLNGNIVPNYTNKAGNISVMVQNGDKIVFRWRDINKAGSDDGLSIDDLSVNFISNVCTPTISNNTATACDQYTWPLTGQTYTTSGTYFYTSVQSSNQMCFDTTYLNLTIIHGPNTSSTVNACNSHTWPENGLTYSASGTYTHSSLTPEGCVSNSQLNLTIYSSTQISFTVSAINSFLWSVSGLTYTTSGMYTYTSINGSGCDSISTLYLTINRVGANMTVQNVVQVSPNIFEYDVILTNTGNTPLGLRGYSCGINHAAGMRGTGTLTHTFISRDPSLTSVPAVSPSYTASNNHLRLITGNTLLGNEVPIAAGTSVRIATMRVTNTTPFPADFNPGLTLQMLTATGKTLCLATCVVTPPGNSFTINGAGNSPLTGSLQVLNGVVSTPCLYLNPLSPFAAAVSFSTPVNCYGQSTGAAQVTLSGLGSAAPNGTTGTYQVDAGSISPYSGNPFTVSNLSAGTHTIFVTTSYGCSDTALTLISGPVTNNLSFSSSSVSACSAYTWNGVTYTISGSPTHTYTNTFGCDSIHTLNITIHPNPIVTSYNVVKCIGGSVELAGSPIGGTFSLANPYMGPPTTYTYSYTDNFGCSAVSTPSAVTETGCNVALHVKMFMQGYYVESGIMNPTLFNEGVTTDGSITDTITIELHNPSPPYGLVSTKKALVHTDGNSICSFDYFDGSYYLTGSYYIAIRHRNSLTTWSANPIPFNSTSVSYDFTTSSSKAYGDNMTEVEPGIWAIYTGELNDDGNIDLLDNPILEDDINNYRFGYYTTDLNGDGNSDLLDLPILETNIFSFVFAIEPGWSGTLPQIITAPVSAISGGTAVSGGNVISDGGSSITERGVCWSTNPNPNVLLSTKTSNGSGTGNFISNITGLTPVTTYFCRAYATGIAGTVYGNSLTFTTTIPLVIGQSYQGGIIAYILQPGDPGYDANVPHGLIASSSDQNTGAEWGCNGSTINGADGTSIGTGYQNTIDIINGCSTAGIAARICGDLILNGYSDWYLPSKDELDKLYQNRLVIGGFTANAAYWSSSESTNYGGTAWAQYFTNGPQNGYHLDNLLFVRAIRSF